jgi:hypothetical protein
VSGAADDVDDSPHLRARISPSTPWVKRA